MSESKLKKPGEYKGMSYREKQRAQVRARWVRLEKIKPTDHKWARRHGLTLKENQAADKGLKKKEE